MVDKIFIDILNEARSRKGKDLVKNIATVSMEINSKLMAAIEAIREQERREKESEI